MKSVLQGIFVLKWTILGSWNSSMDLMAFFAQSQSLSFRTCFYFTTKFCPKPMGLN